MVKPQGNPRTDPRNEAASSLFEVHPQDSRHIEEHRRPILESRQRLLRLTLRALSIELMERSTLKD